MGLGANDVVVWSDPVDAPGNIGATETLSDYLGMGGNLFISGQNIGQKTQDPTNPPHWWQRQLGGQYLNKASEPFTLTADSASLFAGITLNLNGPDSAANQIATDIVRPTPTGETREGRSRRVRLDCQPVVRREPHAGQLRGIGTAEHADDVPPVGARELIGVAQSFVDAAALRSVCNA